MVGRKVGKKIRMRGRKVGRKILIGKKMMMGKKVGFKMGKKIRMRRSGNGVEEADETSEDAYADLYNEYDQLAQDFRECRLWGEA